MLSSGRNVFEELGPGFTLLALDAPEDADRIAAAARERAVPLTVLCDTRAEGRAAYGRKLILVRPDQFIAWTSDTAPQDAAALIAKVAGQ
jgi:4-hydroxyisophthalate hydroxylase